MLFSSLDFGTNAGVFFVLVLLVAFRVSFNLVQFVRSTKKKLVEEIRDQVNWTVKKGNSRVSKHHLTTLVE